MNSLVIAEHDNHQLSPGTLNTVSAATRIGGEVSVLVAGSQCDEVADECARISGVSRVLYADSLSYANEITENTATLVQANVEGYTHVLAPASTFGKALIPYLAALCDVQAISDISVVLSDDTFVRPIYAGNALETVKSHDSIKMMTVRTTAFEAVDCANGHAEISRIPEAPITPSVQFAGQNLSHSERPELASAKIVVSGGRGMKNSENFAMLETLADTLGGAVGASRAAVDAGFVPNDYQVGQTGKVVAPDLYIAVGISGAIQHLAGMKDSKVIVAINNDEEAPIFQVADYGWNEDLFSAVPALQEELEQ